MSFHETRKPTSMRRRLAVATLFVVLSALAVGGALAKGKGNQNDQGANSGNVTVNFSDEDRVVLGNYYGDMESRGHCPPGLAKKHNGCMPPGQAKKWQVGRPLPRDVRYYDLPPNLTVRLTPPPSGYKYVRVAKDILLIAAGTGMVAAGISDLVQ